MHTSNLRANNVCPCLVRVAGIFALSLLLVTNVIAAQPLLLLPMAGTNVAAAGDLVWSLGGTNLVINGDFETGDFFGWVKKHPARKDFVIHAGQYVANSTESPQPVFSGTACAVSDSYTQGVQVLYQDLSIPGNVTSAVLSWVDLIRNYGDVFQNPRQQFRVEVRDDDNEVQEVVYSTQPGEALFREWTRRSADLSRYRGRTIRIAFVETDYEGLLNVYLDEVRVDVTTSDGPEFQVFLSAGQDPVPGTLYGTTRSVTMRYGELLPGTPYTWRVAVTSNGQTNYSARSHFTVGPLSALDHLSCAFPSGTQYCGFPAQVKIQAKDRFENTISNFTERVGISALAGGTRPASVVITELDPRASDSVEFLNVSAGTLKLDGWQIHLYDTVSWPAPRVSIVVPTNSALAAGKLFTLRHSTVNGGRFPSLLYASDIAWGNLPTNSAAAVLLQDSSGNIVDFVCVGAVSARDITEPLPIPASEWFGAPLEATATRFTYQRVGDIDRQNRNDWTAEVGSLGALNQGCSPNFLTGAGPLAVSAPVATDLTNGVWEGKVIFSAPAESAMLVAEDTHGDVGISPRVVVESLPMVAISTPASVREGAGFMKSAGSVVIPFARESALRVSLSCDHPELVSIPEFVEIPSGSTETAFDIRVLDNALLDGTRQVTFTSTAEGYRTAAFNLAVYDDETTALHLSLPEEVVEGQISFQGKVTVDRPVDRDCTVALRAEDNRQLYLPSEVVIPAGETQGVFYVDVVDDNVIESAQVVAVRCEVGNWTPALAYVKVNDDEGRNLVLKVPLAVDGLSGTVQRGGQISIPGVLRSSLKVDLSASIAGLILPATVTILDGESNAFFDISPATNLVFQGVRTPLLTASAPGFISASARVEVTDEVLKRVPLPAGDLVFEPKTGLLLASVQKAAGELTPGIAVIEPVTGQIRTNISLSSVPGALAVTDDGESIYVAVEANTAVQRVHLGSGTVDAPFTIDGGATIRQLAAVAGDADGLLVCSGAGLQLYRKGQSLPKAVADVVNLGAGPQENSWMAFCADDSVHLVVTDDTGVVDVKTAPFDIGWLVRWVKVSDLICDARGRLVNPETLAELPGVAGLSGPYVASDPLTSRVFVLGQGGGGLQLTEADVPTRLAGKFASLPCQSGFNSLVRWGQDGLAFILDDELCLLRSGLVVPGPAADLRLSAALGSAPLTVGSNCTLTVVISNAGPGTASSVRLTAFLPTEFKLTGKAISQGSLNYAYGNLSADAGVLDSGGVVTLTMTIEPQKAGVFEFEPVLRAAQIDPQVTDNRLLVDMPVEYVEAEDVVRDIVINTGDLAYDPLNQRLFVTSPADSVRNANSLIEIDPSTGQIDAVWPIGVNPQKLALSADGRKLYIDLEGESAIRIFDLVSRTPGASFSWGTDRTNPVWSVSSMQAVPGQTDQLAVSFAQGDSGCVVLYEGGVPLPSVHWGYYGTLGCSPDGQQVYLQASPFHTLFTRLKVGADGLELMDTVENLFAERDFSVQGNRIYCGSGVFDRLNGAEILRFEPAPARALVLPIEESGRVFFLQGAGYDIRLTAYDAVTGRYVDDIWQGFGGASDLVRCGPGTLAFRISNSQVSILRSSFIAGEVPTDLRLDLNVTPEAVLLGSNQFYTVTFSNRGTNTAEDVRFIANLPNKVWADSVTVSQGECSNERTLVRGNLGQLAPGETAEATIATGPGAAGLYSFGVHVFSSNLETTPGDNYADSIMRVGALAPLDVEQQVELTNSWMTLDRAGRQLILSVPASAAGELFGDSIVCVDPAKCLPGEPLRVGKEPGVSAVSSDGGWLYVVLAGESAIQEVDLRERRLGRKSNLLSPGSVSDMAVNPARPAEVLFTEEGQLFKLEDGTIQKLQEPQWPVAPTSLAFSEDGAQVALAGGTSLCILTRSNASYVPHLYAELSSYPSRIRFESGKLFLNNGVVLGASDLQYVGVALPLWQRDVVPVPGTTVAFACAGLNTPSIECYDWSTGQQLGSWYAYLGEGMPIPRFEAWGADGLAWRHPERLHINRTSLMPLMAEHDADGDGIPDVWERTHNLNPNLTEDALADSDGDCASNRQEYLAGTDPANPGSVLRVLGTKEEAGSLVVTVSTVPGRAYRLEACSDLGLRDWTPVGEWMQSVASTTELQVPRSAEQFGFLRVSTAGSPQ